MDSLEYMGSRHQNVVGPPTPSASDSPVSRASLLYRPPLHAPLSPLSLTSCITADLRGGLRAAAAAAARLLRPSIPFSVACFATKHEQQEQRSIAVTRMNATSTVAQLLAPSSSGRPWRDRQVACTTAAVVPRDRYKEGVRERYKHKRGGGGGGSEGARETSIHDITGISNTPKPEMKQHKKRTK